MRAEDLGARIEAERATLRALAEAWCPKDGRLVAGIYVVDRQRTVWLRGGRGGSYAEMVAEYERSRRDALSHVRDVLEVERVDLLDDAANSADSFSDLLDEIRENRYPAVAPPMAYRVASLRLPWTSTTPCGCRKILTVRIDIDGVLVVNPATTMR